VTIVRLASAHRRGVSFEHMYAEQMFDPHDSAESLEAGSMVAVAPPVEWQGSLFAVGEPGFDAEMAGVERIWLDATSWVDHGPRWFRGADAVFTDLAAGLRWHQRTVLMYDRLVREPRLTWWWSEGDHPSPPAVLDAARHGLSRRYAREFDSIGCNYYRSGADSVAWHADRIRFYQEDPLVAIVSLGSPRPFLLRPRGGGRSRSFLLGHGDLLVMGGACQHDWEHTVPKVASAGPRISVSYRHDTASPDGASRYERARHPSAGAHKRHTAATAPRHGPGSVDRGGAEQQWGAWPDTVGPETEGPPG
jgi:alkylated DNA repair dioxygenase AlkB